MSTTKDFSLTLKLRNNHIVKRRTELGYRTGNAAARAAGVTASDWCAIEGLRFNPISKRTGLFKDKALKVAVFLGLPPEEIWPAAVLAVVKPVVTTEVDAAEVAAILAAPTEVAALPSYGREEADMHTEVVALVEAARDSSDPNVRLAPIELNILLMHFVEDMTYAEIGTQLGLSRERIRQFEIRALARLRALARRRGVDCPADLRPDEAAVS